ncbi:MAG: endonuclease domain-containing protein [Leptolyngbyaceae cyanobacterium]
MKYPIIPYNSKLKERACQLRQNMTKGEIILWQQLKRKQMMGYDFDRQRPIDQFIVDFYCKALRLAIEIDGSSHDSPDVQAKDQERQAILESLGVRFLRFHDADVKQNLEEVCQVIKKWIIEHRSQAI